MKLEDTNIDLLNLYQEAFEAARMGVWHWDIKKNILSFDTGILKLYEISDSSKMHTIENWISKLHPDDQAMAQKMIEKAVVSDFKIDHQLRIQMPNGNYKHIRTKAKKIVDSNGDALQLLGVNWDITAEIQHKNEKNIFEQNFKLMLSLVESSEDIFGFTDATGIPLYVNKSGLENYGIRVVGGKYFSEYLTKNDQKKINETVVPLLRKGQSWEGEVSIIHQITNESVPLWLRIFCVQPGSGLRKIFYGCLASNLTHIKSIQQTLMQQSKLAALGEITASIAHEINNPLSIIVGKTNLLDRNLNSNSFDQPKATKDIESIQKNSERITKIIKSLNSFSRNSIYDPFAKISLLKVVDDAFEIMKEKFKIELVDFTIIIDEKMNYENKVEIRESEILQVIINLLNNASDAVQILTEKWVKLILVEKKNVYEISIVDSGAGIQSDIASRMMEPFFTTKPTGSGTGLGLSLSSQIMKSHDGNINYNSSNNNTEFILTFRK